MWWNDSFFVPPKRFGFSGGEPQFPWPSEFGISCEKKTLRGCNTPVCGPREGR